MTIDDFRKELLPLMEWQATHRRDPIMEIPCASRSDARMAVAVVKSFWGATSVRALDRKRGPGVYRAVVRVESSSLTVVYHKLDKEEL